MLPNAADLEQLEERISRVEDQERQIRATSQALSARLDDTGKGLGEVAAEIRAFTGEVKRLVFLVDSRYNHLILEQRLEAEFGRHKRTREIAAGFLADLANAEPRLAQLHAGHDDLVLASRSYWLASTLGALSAWLGDADDDGQVLRRALIQDDGKTSLFLCLALRRLGRREAAAWLRRYCATRDPEAVDADFERLALAASAGVFADGGREVLEDGLRRWADETCSRSDWSDRLAELWAELLQARATAADEDSFPLLKRYSPTWPELAACLQWSREQSSIADFLAATDVAGDQVEPADAGAVDAADAEMVDSLLGRLVSQPVAAEEPLRRDYRMAALLIERRGDIEAANEILEREFPPPDTSRRHVFAYLARAAVGTAPSNPELRRMALRVSAPWVESALAMLAERGGKLSPPTIEIRVGDWAGTTRNGENESDLLASFSSHYESARRKEEWSDPRSWIDQSLLVPGVLTLFISLVTVKTVIVPLVALCGFAYYFYQRMKASDKEKEARAQRREEDRSLQLKLVKDILGEAAALRRLVAAKDREFAELPGRAKEAFRRLRANALAEGMGGTRNAMAEAPGLPVRELLPPAIPRTEETGPGYQ